MIISSIPILINNYNIIIYNNIKIITLELLLLFLIFLTAANMLRFFLLFCIITVVLHTYCSSSIGHLFENVFQIKVTVIKANI